MRVKENKKTNIEYLRELIKGNEEANEFLDAIASEIEIHKNEIGELKDEVSSLESDKIDLETEVTNLEEDKEYSDRIDTKMGNKEMIRWEAPNLACKSMMEELSNAIDRGIPVGKIENVLRAL